MAGRSKHIAINKRLTSSTSADEKHSIYQHDGRDFNEVNLATAIHRFSKNNNGASHRSDPRLRALLEQAASSVAHGCWSSRALANVCWAVAKLKVRTPPLFEAIAADAERQVRDFNPQNLANTV